MMKKVCIACAGARGKTLITLRSNSADNISKDSCSPAFSLFLTYSSFVGAVHLITWVQRRAILGLLFCVFFLLHSRTAYFSNGKTRLSHRRSGRSLSNSIDKVFKLLRPFLKILQRETILHEIFSVQPRFSCRVSILTIPEKNFLQGNEIFVVTVVESFSFFFLRCSCSPWPGVWLLAHKILEKFLKLDIEQTRKAGTCFSCILTSPRWLITSRSKLIFDPLKFPSFTVTRRRYDGLTKDCEYFVAARSVRISARCLCTFADAHQGTEMLACPFSATRKET